MWNTRAWVLRPGLSQSCAVHRPCCSEETQRAFQGLQWWQLCRHLYLPPGGGSTNVTYSKVGQKAVALVLWHSLSSWYFWFLCSPAFLKDFQNEPEIAHFTFFFFCPRGQGHTYVLVIGPEPVLRLSVKSTLLPSCVTHARQRCRFAELGGTSALKLGSRTCLNKILFNHSTSACKCLPLHCQSVSVCFGPASLLESWFVFCSQWFLVQAIYHPESSHGSGNGNLETHQCMSLYLRYCIMQGFKHPVDNSQCF